MTQNADGLPHIYSVAREIAYDNGGINRERSEEQQRREFDEFIGSEGYDFADLKKIDEWLTNLNSQQIQILAAGEETERMALIATVPHEFQQKLDQLFDNYFDEVC